MTKVHLAIALCLVLLGIGCGGGHHFVSPTPSASQVSVTVTPATAQLNGGQTLQFTATVTNATDRSVRWRVTGGGTITAAGLYTAPSPVGTNITDRVTAISIEDSTKSGSATVNFTPVSVHVSPQDPSVAITTAQQFTAEVTGSTNTAVTWTLSGEGCTGANCGVITAAGLYSPPWCVPVPATVTVTATAVADPSKSASTVVSPVNLGPILNGAYTFLYSGIDSNGRMVESVGRFVAEAGSVTNGLSDVVNFTNTRANVTFTGSYDNRCYARGVLNLTDSDDNTHSYAYSLNLHGDRGQFIEMNNTAGRGTGTLVRQTLPSNGVSGGLGTFVFGFSGTAPELIVAPLKGRDPSIPLPILRAAFAGQMTLDGDGGVAGVIDANYAGTTLANSTLSGTYVFDSSAGRGTATFTAGVPLDETYHLSFYPASADEVFWIGLDSPLANRPQQNQIIYGFPLYGGVALRQAGPFDIASLNATSVLHLTGVEAETNDSDVLVGMVSPDGSGNISSGVLDENDDGTLTNYPSLTGTYTLDESPFGRGTLHLDLGGGNARDLTFYLVDSNKAFLLDGTDTDDGPNVGVGFLEGQTGAPFSAASFTGPYSIGTLSFPTNFTPVNAGILLGDGQGSLTGIGDYADINGYQSGVTVFGNYTIPASGRGAYAFMNFYMISPTKAIMFEYNDSQHQPTLIAVEQ